MKINWFKVLQEDDYQKITELQITKEKMFWLRSLQNMAVTLSIIIAIMLVMVIEV